MSKKTTADYIRILQDRYFPGKYKPQSQFINELNLLHAVKLTGLGGEQALNDANTKVEVGVSDFNGTLTPTDANGLIHSLTVRYGLKLGDSAFNQPGLIRYTNVTGAIDGSDHDFMAWFLNSELILKTRGIEQIRMRIRDLMIDTASDKVPSEVSKELEKTIKVEGGQDLQLFLSTPKGATLDAVNSQFIQVVLYGIKFGDRKTA